MEAFESSFGKRIGGRLCLDFINTVSGRVRGDRIVGERLVSYEALLQWGMLAGVVTASEARSLSREASRQRVRAAMVLERSITVREGMYRVFKAALAGCRPRPKDLMELNRELRIARAHQRLVAGPRFQWEWDRKVALDRLLWPVVISAAELLTSSDLERLGQCPGDECRWLFLDTSRSRRRQWCNMADCGNVAKVRRFRQKHTKAQG